MSEDNEQEHDQHGAHYGWRDNPSSVGATPPSVDEDDDIVDSGPPTSSVRISAVEAAVAAGLAPSTSRLDSYNDTPQVTNEAEQSNFLELPAWTDPPTGQVPKILLDADTDYDDPSFGTRGPSWREDSADWDGDIDLSIFAADIASDESDEIAGQESPVDDLHPYTFGDLGLGDEQPVVVGDEEDDDSAWAAVLGEGDLAVAGDDYGLASFGPSDEAKRSRRRSGGGAHRAKPQATVRNTGPVEVVVADDTPKHTKRGAVATVTGLVAAAVAIICFFLGSVPTIVLVTVAVMVGSGELFAVLRKVGFQPATPPGLVIVGALVIGTYLRGSSAVPVVLGVGFLAMGLWYLSGRGGDRAVVNIGATCAVILWVGLLGSFAGLLLAPSAHPHRHGIALLVGLIIITVAHDVGSYVVGGRFGKHPLAPHVSPNKSIEGLIGGTIFALLVAVLIVPHLHPFGFTLAFELGLAVAIFAPFGDLVESLIKRDLGVKDMGNLLPGHGGILDRIDAMLFVLPMTYFLASVHHLS